MDDREQRLYELHSRLDGFKYRIKQARRIAKDGFATIDCPYASLSFGKDSIVMVHLLLSINPHLPVMYVNCGEWDEWPDTPRVKREFLKQFPCNFIELRGPSIVEAYRAAGFYIQEQEDSKDARKVESLYSKSLAEILTAAARWHGFDGAFIGLRKEESYGRAKLFQARGALYFAETRQAWACHPIIHLTARDVWAYIIKHDLPYNELYDLDPRGREIARNGAMFGTRSKYLDRMAFLRQMYPDWFNRFAAEFPEVRCYV